MVNITHGFLLLLMAVTVLAGPERTLIVLIAAAVHELGHIAALRLLGARIDGLALGASGARIVFSKRLSYPGEILAALSGPMAGAMLAGLALWAGKQWGSEGLLELAGVSALYTAVNLLPVSVADGGRALDAALCLWLGPDTAYVIGALADIACVSAAFLAGMTVFFRSKGGLAPLLYAFFLLNVCCKRRGFRVKSR